MKTREMTAAEFMDFPDQMQDMVLHFKKALKEYTKKHKGADLTIICAAMGAVALDVCEVARKEHGPGMDYKAHAVGVFKTIVENV